MPDDTFTFADGSTVILTSRPFAQPLKTKWGANAESRDQQSQVAPGWSQSSLPSLLPTGQAIADAVLSEDDKGLCQVHAASTDPSKRTHEGTFTLWVERHGTAENNHAAYYMEGKRPTDAALIPEGEEESELVGGKIKELSDAGKINIRAVMSSPLRRTIQTAQRTFKDLDVPILATEVWREAMDENHCNARDTAKTGYTIPDTVRYIGSVEDRITDPRHHDRGAESDEAAQERVPDALETTLKVIQNYIELDAAKGDETSHVDLAVVTHGDFAKYALLPVITGSDLGRWANGAVKAYDFSFSTEGDVTDPNWRGEVICTGEGPAFDSSPMSQSGNNRSYFFS